MGKKTISSEISKFPSRYQTYPKPHYWITLFLTIIFCQVRGSRKSWDGGNQILSWKEITKIIKRWLGDYKFDLNCVPWNSPQNAEARVREFFIIRYRLITTKILLRYFWKFMTPHSKENAWKWAFFIEKIGWEHARWHTSILLLLLLLLYYYFYYYYTFLCRLVP